MPLTQTDIADSLGLTSVHVNRMLQRMRSAGLISLSAKMLTILDAKGLAKASAFDPGYLHLERWRGDWT